MATTFNLFLSFPLELQDYVWERAVPVIPAVGAVYNTHLVRQARHTDEDGSLDLTNPVDRVHLFRAPSPPTPLEATLAALSALLVTCRRSSAVALNAYGRLRQQNPFPLRREGLVDLQIDASSDLVVLQEGWRNPCRLIAASSFTRLQLPQRIRHIGIAWPGSKRDSLGRDLADAFYHSQSLDGLLALWGPGLAALYVVVEPPDLEDRPWDKYGDWPEMLPIGPAVTVQTHILDCENDERDDIVFVCEDREYYELPSKQLRRYGGLEKGICMLETARMRCTPRRLPGMGGEEDEDQRPPPPRCRILTWRSVPRVVS